MRSTLVAVAANKFAANKMLGLPQNTEKCLICSLQQQIFEYLLGAKYFFSWIYLLHDITLKWFRTTVPVSIWQQSSWAWWIPVAPLLTQTNSTVIKRIIRQTF